MLQFLNFNILMILLFRLQQVLTQCSYAYINNNEVKLNMTVQNQYEDFGIGIWIKFLPFYYPRFQQDLKIKSFLKQDENKIQYEEEDSFIFSILDQTSKYSQVIMSQKLNEETRNFDHQIRVLIDGEIKQFNFTIEKLSYEGEWIMLYCFFNFSQPFSQIGLYQNGKNLWNSEYINGLPQLTHIIKIHVGEQGRKELIGQVYKQFSLFKGLISQPLITRSNIIGDFQGYSTCDDTYIQYYGCYEQQVIIVSDPIYLNGNQILNSNSAVFRSDSFKFQGWVKLDPNYIHKESTIIKITNNNNQLNDQLLGDKFLYLVYIQDKISDLNGFKLTTYSYTDPSDLYYQSSSTDTIQDFDKKYQEYFILWHLIQFEGGPLDNNGQPLFKIRIPNQETLSFTWPKHIKQFSQQVLYFFVGGDKFSSSFLQGYVSNFQATSTCDTIVFGEVELICHKSCQTCDGPTQFSCLSCSTEQFRYYSAEQKICNCQEGYYELKELPECLSLFFRKFPIVEKELYFGSHEYNQFWNYPQCLYGYFPVQQICVQCPYFNQLDQRKLILCADCYIFAESFSFLLQCTFDFQTYYQNVQNVYQKINRNPEDIEQYILFKAGDMQYQIKRKLTFKLECPNGFFYSSHKKCELCPKNCQICQEFQVCQKCIDNYQLSPEGICSSYSHCLEFINLGILQICSLCENGYYVSQQKCLQCGENCKQCDKLGFCLLCNESTNNYILLDGRNCSKCMIQNCIKCFQYYFQNESIYTSLDNQFNIIELNSIEIFQGCALCQNGYFFNLQNSNCELKCSHIVDPQSKQYCLLEYQLCDFGVVDFNRTIQCIKRSNFTQSIENNECEWLPNCQSCIDPSFNQGIPICVQCKQGYYLERRSQLCKICEESCIVCFQQNKQLKDYYKEDLIAFKLYLREQYSQSNQIQHFLESEIELELICLKCQNGYLLFLNQCIKQCDSSCEQCEIQHGKATCIKCKSFISQISRNEFCYECPKYCSACIDRTEKEIQDYNPMFIKTHQNLKYTRKCFEIIDLDDKNSMAESSIFIDPITNLIVQCSNQKGCKQIFNVIITMYCSLIDFWKNYQTNNVFSYLFLPFEEGVFKNFSNYLNEAQAQEILMNISVLQGTYPFDCEAENHFIFKNSYLYYVFSLRKVNLLLNGVDKTTFILLNETIQFQNFTQISLKNLNFKFNSFKEDEIQEFSLIIDTYFPSIQIILENCSFTTSSLYQQGLVFLFLVNQPYNLSLINVKFYNIYFVNSWIFSQNYSRNNANSFRLFVQNLQIHNVKLMNSTFFLIQALNVDFLFEITINQLITQSLQFQNSSLIKIISDSILIAENTQITYLVIDDAIIFNESVIFQLPLILQLQVDQCYFSNLVVQNSTIFKISSFMIKHFSLINSFLTDSQFINNKIDSQQLRQLFNDQKIKWSFTFGEFYNIQLDNSQPFITITKIDISLEITCKFQSIIIQHISQLQKLNREDAILDNSFFVLECYQCELKDIIIEKNPEKIEIFIKNSVVIDAYNISIQQTNTQNQINEILLNFQNGKFISLKLPCIYISQFKDVIIDNLDVSKCVIHNYPFIIIDETIKSRESKEQSVVFSNSQIFNNFIYLTLSEQPVSILLVQSIQICFINIKNVNLVQNYFYQLAENFGIVSSATFIFQVSQGKIHFVSSKVLNNSALNTKDSISYFRAKSIFFDNLNYSHNNFYNIDRQNNLANGGNAMIICEQITILNVSISQSRANKGGAFYLQTNGIGLIEIRNSFIYDVRSVLSNQQKSLGGCFYIDSSISNLNCQIYNTTIDTASSGEQGGAIFIQPSPYQNHLQFRNLVIIDCFSKIDSFLSYTFTYQEGIESKILIKNSQFTQTKNGPAQFLVFFNYTIYDISISNILISLNCGNFSLENLMFTGISISSLFQLTQGLIVKLKDIKIQNCKFTTNSLVIVSLFSGYVSQSQNQIAQNIVLQLLIYNITVTNIVSTQLSNRPLDSLILISNLYPDHFVMIQSLILEDIVCKTCKFGIFSLKLSEEEGTLTTRNQLYLKNLNLFNNNCGEAGCITIQKSFSFSSTRVLNQNSENYQQFSGDVLISESIFQYNEALKGGSLYLNQLNIVILKCVFLKNKAQLGGAIYYQALNTQLIIMNSVFTENTAEKVGGIYLENFYLGDQIQLTNIIQNNNSTQGEDDLSENPRSFTISLDGGISLLEKQIVLNSNLQVLEKIIVNPYKILGSSSLQNYIILPSGIEIQKYEFYDENSQKRIPYNLTFRIVALNKFMKQEKQLNNNALCTLNSKALSKFDNFEANDISSSLSKSTVSFNQSNSDFNLDDLIVSFNSILNNNYYLRIAIQCNFVQIPVYGKSQPYLIQNYIQNYTLYVDIQTFPCQVGEYLNNETGDCIICDETQNLYSVKKNASNCTFKDDILIDRFTSSSIQLRPTYWRANQESDKIEYCHNSPKNCLGGWFPGDDSCELGHLGALCEQCDLYNIRGKGQFSTNNNYECIICSTDFKDSVAIYLLSIWMIISIIITVESTKDIIVKKIIWSQYSMTEYLYQNSTAIFIKLFINYLQIILALSYFQIQIPNKVLNAYTSIGNPIKYLFYYADCFLANRINIHVSYFRIIWSMVSIIFFIFAFSFINFLQVIFWRNKTQINLVNIAILYMYIYTQPNLMELLTSQLSYRTISDIRWIQGNVSLQFSTQTHYQWLLYLVIPLSILVGIIIPLFLWLGIYRNRKSLKCSQVQRKWGYLLNEYKGQAYFWDILKLLQKQLIMLVLNHYEDFVPVKASLIVIIFSTYSLLQAQINPFISKQLNNLETQVMTICSSSIILGSCIYQAQKLQLNEIIWPFYLLISFLNFKLFLKFLRNILLAYFVNLNVERLKNFIVKHFPKIVKIHPILTRFLLLETNKAKTRSNYEKIRSKALPNIKLLIMQQSKFLQQLIKNNELKCKPHNRSKFKFGEYTQKQKANSENQEG